MKTRIAMLPTLLLMLAAAPGSEPQAREVPADAQDTIAGRSSFGAMPYGWSLLNIGGWNTMLQPWLPYEAKVIDTVAKTSFDVLTLSEVWSESAKEKIVSNRKVKARYPYHYYAPPRQEPAFSSISVPPLFQEDYFSCMIVNGIDPRTAEQPIPSMPIDCVVLGLNVKLIDSTSYACLVNTMQALPAGTHFTTAINLCIGGGVKYAHGGSPGRLILSRKPLSDVVVTEAETDLVRRINIFATIAGVRFAFVHWPINSLAEIDPNLGPFESGALQPQFAADVLSRNPDVIVGDFNSGPDFQPEGHNLLVQNGYAALFSRPTYCPESTHGSFPLCGEGAGVGRGPRTIDNIYIKHHTGLCLPYKFALKPASDHAGVSALCALVRGR